MSSKINSKIRCNKIQLEFDAMEMKISIAIFGLFSSHPALVYIHTTSESLKYSAEAVFLNINSTYC